MAAPLPYDPLPGADRPGSLAEAVQANLYALAMTLGSREGLALVGGARKIAFGTAPVTFTASATSAVATVAHGLGSVVTAVYFGDLGGVGWAHAQVVPGSMNQTSFGMQAREVTGAAVTGSNQIAWLATG